jgi:predicted transcriptional regulator
MIQEIIEYKNIVSNLENLMNESPFKKNYIIEKAGIPSPTFYRKLKTQSFTPDEMLSIAKIISPEENFKMELNADIEKAKREFEAGDYFTHEEMLLEFKRKGII